MPSRNSADMLIEQLKSEAREQEIATRDWHRRGMDTVSFELVSRSKQADLERFIADTYGNLEPVSDPEGGRIAYRLTETEVTNIRQLAVSQALETIRNRVDEFGVSEPTIQRSGANGILIQLPGVQDPERAKRLIGRTAQLQFQLIAPDPEAPGVQALAGSDVEPISGRPIERAYAVEPTVLMTGEVISDARHRPGQFGESPYVEVTLNGRGARLFERITSDSVR